MVTVVVYDIPNDRLRQKIANACKDLGLVRVQYSTFVGYLPYSRRTELELRARRILGANPGNVRWFPVCERDLCLAREISAGGYRPWR